MVRKLTLSPILIFTLVGCIFTGELMSGTGMYFATMASLATLFACLTYNILDGLGSITGIAFARFALSTLVISQIGKVLTLQRADQNLDAPTVVITVYTVYFLSAMIGVFLFSRVRLPLPKPVEPETPAQSRYLYYTALVGGILGTVGLFLSSFQGASGMTSLRHGVSLLLSELMPFSLVLAVDERIRSTEGRHSIGWMAFLPMLTMELQGFLGAGRQGFVEPFAIIFLTCYLRGFQFSRKHFIGAAALTASFFFFVSPFYLYARAARSNPTPGELANAMIDTLRLAPSEWSTITHYVGSSASANPGTPTYFQSEQTVTVTLNRFALIAPDSTLINACARGYHYGITALKLDFLSGVPRFLYRNKPDVGSEKFLGQLDGQEADSTETTTYSTITAIADSYGGFGWLGVAVIPFFLLPAIVVVYESIFDMSKPWGTVATLLLLLGFTEGSLGHMLFDGMIKDPLYILVLSWATAWIVRMIPVTGDRVLAPKRFLSGTAVEMPE